jgi:hypothetical protein
MPSYIEFDKNVSVPASSDVSKLILSLNALGQLVVTNNTGISSFPTFTTASPTYPDIDLSSGNYTILGGGIYEIVNASANELVFPDPATLTGQTITIINSDASYPININNNGFKPYDRGSSSQISSISNTEQYQFVAIKDKWRGGSFR